MKVIIAGSRKLWPGSKEFIEAIKASGFDVQTIISGMADGVDRCAADFAERYCRNFDVVKFPANWKKYGKRAGYIRNVAMAEYAEALIVIRKERSRGTDMMIEIAEKKGMPVYIHDLENSPEIS